MIKNSPNSSNLKSRKGNEGSNIRSNIHSDTINPTEKIKEIEKEIKRCEHGFYIDNDTNELKAKLQVYKEWEEREAEILEIIEKQLKENHNNLKNKNLPNMSQANLSGMIIALEILKSKIKGEKLK